MTKIVVSNVDSRAATTNFLDPISANNAHQWVDTYGVIKTGNPNVGTLTIPSGTNGISVGSITIGLGSTVTVQGNWRII